MPEGSQRVELVARLQLGEQPRARADCLEDEPTGVVLDPRNAEGPPEQRCRAIAAAELREGAGHRCRGEMRQPHHQLEQSTSKPFHDEDLAGLERRSAQIRRHDTACTTPSRYSRTVATRTLFPDACRPMASTSADAVSSEVQHGIRRCSAASLMRYPSFTVRPTAAAAPPSARKSSSSVPKFETVLMTIDTRPSSITSMTLGRPCPILPTDTADIPALARAVAVPPVA